MDVPYTTGSPSDKPPSSALLSSPPLSLRRRAGTGGEGGSSGEGALSGQPSSKPDKATTSSSAVARDYQELESGKVLQLHKVRAALPWAGDTLSPEDTQRSYHAITSMVLAFALYADISGEDLPDLMLVALTAQQGLDGADGIDEGVLAVLDRLGFKW